MRRCAGPNPCSPCLQLGLTLTEAARAENDPVHDDEKGGDAKASTTINAPMPSRKHTVKQIWSPTGISRATLYAYVEEFAKQPCRDQSRCRLSRIRCLTAPELTLAPWALGVGRGSRSNAAWEDAVGNRPQATKGYGGKESGFSTWSGNRSSLESPDASEVQ